MIAAVLEAITDTPRLVVDRAVLRANIAAMAAAAREAGVRLRPHVKTHKSPLIARMQLDAGADGIQVAKLGEAEVMAAAGADDILVGYPIVGAEKLERLAALARRVRTSVATDDLEVARGVSSAAHQAGVEIGLYLEVDSSAHRLGVAPERAAEAAGQMAGLSGIGFRGIFTHEGHVYRSGPGDEIAAVSAQVADTMRGVARGLEAAGIECPEVSVGSTPSVRFMLGEDGVTTVRPGTYVFNDRTNLELGAATADQLAAYVVATVVGRPALDRVVVDAGSKALSSDQRPFAPSPPTYGLVLGEPEREVVGLSEEHGLVRVDPGEHLRIGDRVAILPNHICAVVNLWDEMTVVEDGHVVDAWPVAARGMMR